MTLVDVAPWIALASAVAMIGMIGYAGYAMWQQWRVFDRTRVAASALLDVHLGQLDDGSRVIGDHAAATAARGEVLRSDVEQLTGAVAHLRWLLSRVDHERSRLRRAILDLLLPTDD